MNPATQQLIQMILVAIAAVAAVAVLFGLYRLGRRLFARGMQRRLERWQQEDMTGRCKQCGYDLRGLDIPRCPECGCARGFDKTFEELGINERDVQAHVAHRRRVLETVDKMELLNPYAAEERQKSNGE